MRPAEKTLQAGDYTVLVQRKAIKNMYLRVDPASGCLKVSAPRHVSDAAILDFVLRRQAWIEGAMGRNLAATGWAMITTGRRRHREGYHFATEVARKTARKLKIPFYEDAIQCGNADRLKPVLTIKEKPKEKNLILFDDIITTGTTASKTAELLEQEGYTVITIIGIRNQ